MTKKAHRDAAVHVPVQAMAPETALAHDPMNVRIVKRELHRLEHRIIREDGNISDLCRILKSTTVEELWEVPG